jgi:hypothetical protein
VTRPEPTLPDPSVGLKTGKRISVDLPLTNQQRIQVDATTPIVVTPIVKPWYESRTIRANAAIIAAWVITTTAAAAGVFALTPAEVAILGIVSGAINLGLRLSTNAAIAGTPASIAKLEPPAP